MAAKAMVGIIATLLASTVAISCSSSSNVTVQSQPTEATPLTSVPSTAASVDEAALAKSMLLNVKDFPTGWAEKQSQNSNTKIFDQCDPQVKGRTSQAKTGDFSQGQTASISEGISVFDNSRDASVALDNVQSAAQCAAKLINDGRLDDSQYAYSNASFSPVSFPQFGDRSNVFRLQLHVKVKGQTGLGSEGDAFADIAFVIVGRIGFSLQAFDAFTPFDSTQLQSIVSKAEMKVRLGLLTQSH